MELVKQHTKVKPKRFIMLYVDEENMVWIPKTTPAKLQKAYEKVFDKEQEAMPLNCDALVLGKKILQIGTYCTANKQKKQT